MRLDRTRDGLPYIGCVAGPAQVPRARTFFQDGLDRAHDGIPSILVPEMLEHHRARPDLPDGICDLLAVDVRRAAVHGLEARRKLALRIEVRGRRDADRPGARGPEVRKDVAEEVG